MDRLKKTARKSTGGMAPKTSSSYSSNHSLDSVEVTESVSSSPPKSYNNSGNNLKRDAGKAGFPSIKPSPDVSPMELQIRELELMEEQCDSLEKLVEIAAERRDIEREMLEIKKRKLALLEKQMKNM